MIIAASQPVSEDEANAPSAASAPDDRPLVYRHRRSTRIWHWVNALAVFVMLMSGLMIFNAHPRLYWGQYGANFDTPWLVIGSTRDEGFVEVGGLRVTTTGVLGRWTDGEGRVQTRAFPGWATIPSTYSLSGARRWHFAFAWVLALGLLGFWLRGLANRHVQRDLAPRAGELAPRHVLRSIKEHALLRHPTGEAALRYNILQKLSYVGVIFVLLPLMILSGLGMSPGVDAAWPWVVDLLGGRQSARSIHFIAAMLLLLFIIVHLTMVVLAGPLNEIRSMVTGYFRVPPDPPKDEAR
jgi:thiosulfate reductase cytochrome b subunit